MFRFWRTDLFEDLENLNFEWLYDDNTTGGYCLQSSEPNSKGMYIYQFYDEDDHKMGEWKSAEDSLALTYTQFLNSINYRVMLKYIESLENKQEQEYYKSGHKKDSYFDNEDDDIFSHSSYSYTYTPPKKSTGFLDKLNKSDTLVIHCQDRSTEMLSQIYEGKGWDVLRDGNIDKDELHQLLQSHDRIIMLGHGTSGGLLNIQGGGCVIGSEEAPYLKDKKTFTIWCNADAYAKRHGLHGFWTGNMPSDSGEAYCVGFKVSPQYMLDNITYWSKCCAEVVEQCLEGDAKAGAKKAREMYLAKYGPDSGNDWNDQEIGITLYNAERTEAV